MRIVSLLPSATEIVCALGLRDELVGVTHECDWPPDVVGLPVMTRNALDLHGATSREIHQRSARRSMAARRSTSSTRTRSRRPMPT
jgi:hypothetical protein